MCVERVFKDGAGSKDIFGVFNGVSVEALSNGILLQNEYVGGLAKSFVQAPRKKAAAVPVAPTLPADPLMSELSTRPETESRTGTEPESTEPLKLVWERKNFGKSDWTKGLWFTTKWEQKPLKAEGDAAGPCLLIGGGEFARQVQASMENVVVAEHAKALALDGANNVVTADLRSAEHAKALLQHKPWAVICFAAPVCQEDVTIALDEG